MLLKKIFKTLFVTFFIVAVFSPLSAQQDNKLLFGVYGGLNTNQVPAFNLPTDLYQDKTIPTPIINGHIAFFENYSPSLGIFINYALTSSLDLSARLGYTKISGEFTGSIPGNGDTVIKQDLDFASHNLEFSPVFLFKNILLKDLYLLAGGEIGFPLSDSYNYTQQLTSSAGDTTAMFAIDEKLQRHPTRLALVAGIGYNFNAGNVVAIAPEISFRAPLTSFDISQNIADITVRQLRFSLNISFLPETLQPIAERDLRVMIDSVGTYQSDGNFTLLKALKVEDVQYSEMYPLIPYIFYQKSAAEPIKEYALVQAIDERGSSNIPVLKPDALDINKQTLNIIGNRMKTEFPQSLLKITGTIDGKTEAKEIAQQRAEFAKNYLVKIMGIEAARITTDARGLPLKPSVTTVAEGDVENRRVEFWSATPELLAPIMMAGENERVASPELVEFRPYAVSADSITEWTLRLMQSGRVLREYKGTGVPLPQRWLIRPNELAGVQIPVDYTFTATTSHGLSKTANGSLPVDYVSSVRKKTENIADKTVSKYSLILFDFDNAEITPENQRIIENIILPSLKFNSTVKIYGHTDKIGEEKYNRELSLKRAENVRNVLKAKVAAARYQVFGSGESTELFDNNSPIGRHLSRTVVIVIETPR